MSWSVSAVGRAAAVAKEIERQLSVARWNDTTESDIRELVGAAILKALEDCDPGVAISVSASGSMSQSLGTHRDSKPCKTHTLLVEIERLHGWVE